MQYVAATQPKHRHASADTAARPVHGTADEAESRRRLGKLAHVLDSAFELPGGYRVGLDGFIGRVIALHWGTETTQPKDRPMRFRYLMLVLACTTLPFLAGCDVDVEEKGEMPQVDVDADPGQLPEYEVEKTEAGQLPSMDVDAEPGKLPEVDVQGPDVDVGTEPVTIPVPDVDVDMPDDDGETSQQQ
ncbi:hypothetical protein [uncultured Thiohalocapsa sp.]|uniref:hypothetical protein n=1 Tax=uncultured Thiohalocapsa sp. TaxID=768990 RepID=UPI0025EDEE1C|nr:hypothetical protein [uncultured Thiohalocapsa sp.]